MFAGYGNDNDNDGNSYDEDVYSTDFTMTWQRLYLILFFLKWGSRAEGRRAKNQGRGSTVKVREKTRRPDISKNRFAKLCKSNLTYAKVTLYTQK